LELCQNGYSETKPVINVSDVSWYPHEKRQEHPLPTEFAGLIGPAWPGESAKHNLANVGLLDVLFTQFW
jgi:hypothetical protein